MKSRQKNKSLILLVGIGAAIFFLVLAWIIIQLFLDVPSEQQAEQAIRSEFSEILGVTPERGNIVAQAIADNLDVSVEKVERSPLDQKTYYVTCMVANRDIQSVYAQVDESQQMTLNEFMQWFVQKLSEQPQLQYQETFVLYKEDSEYQVQMSEEQLDHCWRSGRRCFALFAAFCRRQMQKHQASRPFASPILWKNSGIRF